MGTLPNSGDPELESALFSKIKQSPGTEIHLNLEILIYDPLIWTMNHPRLIISNQMKNLLVYKVNY